MRSCGVIPSFQYLSVWLSAPVLRALSVLMMVSFQMLRFLDYDLLSLLADRKVGSSQLASLRVYLMKMTMRSLIIRHVSSGFIGALKTFQ